MSDEDDWEFSGTDDAQWIDTFEISFGFRDWRRLIWRHGRPPRTNLTVDN
jgi:hypothetical protein